MSAPDVMVAHDGDTFNPERDMDRLNSLRERVLSYMLRHGWVTLDELVKACGGTTASASAKLRDARKLRFGAWIVERRHVTGGLYEYKISSQNKGGEANAEA